MNQASRVYKFLKKLKSINVNQQDNVGYWQLVFNKKRLSHFQTIRLIYKVQLEIRLYEDKIKKNENLYNDYVRSSFQVVKSLFGDVCTSGGTNITNKITDQVITTFGMLNSFIGDSEFSLSKEEIKEFEDLINELKDRVKEVDNEILKELLQSFVDDFEFFITCYEITGAKIFKEAIEMLMGRMIVNKDIVENEPLIKKLFVKSFDFMTKSNTVNTFIEDTGIGSILLEFIK